MPTMLISVMNDRQASNNPCNSRAGRDDWKFNRKLFSLHKYGYLLKSPKSIPTHLRGKYADKILFNRY